MNFGSKYVYRYDHSDEESVSGDSDFSSESDSSEEDSFGQVAAAGLGGGSEPHSYGNVASAGFGSKVKNRLSGLFSLGGGPKKPAKKKKVPHLRARSRQAGARFQTDSLAPFPAPAEHRQPRTKVRKADPNLFTVSVGENVVPKDPLVGKKSVGCGDCPAIVTASSKFQVKEGVNNWLCDFCRGFNREIDVTDWTKPETDDVTYELLAPALEAKEQKTEERHNVIFVIDISGSMGCTMENDIVTASGSRTRTFVSRLEAVIKAAEHQIRQIREETPNVGVGLISFGSAVTVYGDGTTPPKTLKSEEMQSQEVLKAVASDFPSLRPIRDTFDALTGKLVGLEIRGCTALGPGLLSGISLAANTSGSKVIICTDGCANEGFGALPGDDCQDENKITASRSAYKQFGDYAKSKSVTVSVISLEGTDCRLVHLGLVAQITGGVVEIVDPRNMSTQFGNILASKVIATDVTVTIILDHSLYIRDLQTTEQKSTQVQQLGNVSADTEIVVEFGVRTLANENEQPMTIDDEDKANESNEDNEAPAAGADVTCTSAACEEDENMAGEPVAARQTISEARPDEAASLPFQVQLEFTTRSGGKYRRVITILRETTDKRETAEAELNMNIVGAATSNTVSNVALAGNVQKARGAIYTRRKMAQRFQGQMTSLSSDSERIREETTEYLDDLDDLSGLIAQQSQVVHQKQHKYMADCLPSGLQFDSIAPPPPVMRAGPASASMPPPPPSQMVAAAPGGQATTNMIPDKLAHAYYARSKGSYGNKKK